MRCTPFALSLSIGLLAGCGGASWADAREGRSLQDLPPPGSADVTQIAPRAPVTCFDDGATDTGAGDCATGFEDCDDGGAYQVECRADASFDGMTCECYENGARVAVFQHPTKACLQNVGWLNARCGFALAAPAREPAADGPDLRAQLSAATAGELDLDLHVVAADAWGAHCVDVDVEVGGAARAMRCDDAALDCAAGRAVRFGGSACVVEVEDGTGVERGRVDALPDGVFLIAIAAAGAPDAVAGGVAVDLVLGGRPVARIEAGDVPGGAFVEVATIEKEGAAFVVERLAAYARCPSPDEG